VGSQELYEGPFARLIMLVDGKADDDVLSVHAGHEGGADLVREALLAFSFGLSMWQCVASGSRSTDNESRSYTGR